MEYRHLEVTAFMKLIGRLDNKAVVDLACGDGYYTKKIRELTTGIVYGIDVSSKMIELAKL